MELNVNGELVMLPKEMSIKEFLVQKNVYSEYVVVELNGEIISKQKHASTLLRKNDTIEILKLVCGG